MSSSTNPVLDRESITISFEDTTEQVDEKIKQIFFPPERDPSFEGYYDPADFGPDSREIELHNPGLQLFEYHVFPRYDRVTVERPAEYGGNVTYGSFEELAVAVESGEIHPADAKDALATDLNTLVEPGREQLRD